MIITYFYSKYNALFIYSLTLCCIIIASSVPLSAQNWNQIIKTEASDRAVDDHFGFSVAISGDYAIVGAYYEDEDDTGGNTKTDAGSAYIFKRTGTTWTQEAKIVAADREAGDNFGYSVAISGDYAIVGAWKEKEDAAGGNTLTAAGSAYIFKRTGTTWTQEAKIVAVDREAEDVFGFSVAISGDYATVGAWIENEDAASLLIETIATILAIQLPLVATMLSWGHMVTMQIPHVVFYSPQVQPIFSNEILLYPSN